MIDVIIPAFNPRAATLGRAVRSVLAQQGVSRIVLVDDASTAADADAALSHVQQLDARVCLVRLRTNHGPAVARNIGMATCESPLIAFLDQDDEHLSGSYARLASILQTHPSLACVRGQIEYAGLPADVAFDHSHALYPQVFNSCIWNGLYRRSALAAVGGFPTGAEFCGPYAGEDVPLLHAVESQFLHLHVAEVITRHHTDGDSHLVAWLRGRDPERFVQAYAPWSAGYRAYRDRVATDVAATPRMRRDQPAPIVIRGDPTEPAQRLNVADQPLAAIDRAWRPVLQSLVGQPMHGLVLGCSDVWRTLWLAQEVFIHPNSKLLATDDFENREPTGLQRLCLELAALRQTERVRLFAAGTERYLRSNPAERFALIAMPETAAADATVQNAVLAWPLLADGGVMLWLGESQPGLDAFCAAYASRLTRHSIAGASVLIKCT